MFPNKLKIAKIIPIHKKGDTQIVDNYRPISLLPAFSKIFEKVVNKRLVSYLMKFSIIPECQYGFLPGKNTEMTIYNFVVDLIRNLDEGNMAAGVFYDLSKAFDTVSHELLLLKLEAIGIRGNALKLLESYLTNRKQRVCIKGECNGVWREFLSAESNIYRGVPQGSILGPTLFLVYIRDLPASLHSTSIYQYADDTSCIVSQQNIQNLSLRATDICGVVNKWCQSNALSLNKDKTVAVLFNGRSTECLDIQIENKSIENLDSCKFLGVAIDSSLTWFNHIDYVLGRLNSAFYMIYNLRDYTDLSVLKTIYYSNVYPHLKYGLILWGASTKLQRVLISQKKIIRCMAKVRARTPCRELFRALKILPVPALYIFELAVFAYKNPQFFTRNSDVFSGMLTRNASNLSVPRHRTCLFERSPEYRAIKVYNGLPNSIKLGSKNLHDFKCSLREILLDKCCYTYNEYFNGY